MGITIHYDFKFQGSRKRLRKTLVKIHEKISNLEIKDISPIGEREFEDCNNGWKMKQGMGFRVYPMNGSESFEVVLFYRENDTWTSHFFTKTQYADDFEKCHKLVITMLEICKKYGILRKVHDEAHYWKNRDTKKLNDNFTESRNMIEFFSQALQQGGFSFARGDGKIFKGKRKDEE